jgi:3-oxoacyl-[acyl-carrier protein] reductase
MSDLLSGKAALITGGAHGIGPAIAQEFGAHGASVVVADIDGGNAAKAAAQ